MAAAYVQQVIHFLFPKDCFEELFINYNFFHEECNKLVLSRFLGLGIIAGSLMVKVPQIMKMVNAKSGVGVSFSAQALELVAATATMAYSYVSRYPFSSWGESLFLSLQTMIICLLILAYSGRSAIGALFLAVYTSVTAYLMLGYSSPAVLQSLIAANIPIVAVAKAIQAIQNYQMGSTGQLSIVTVFLMFAGSLARIFTSMQETRDQLVIASFIVSSFMNGIIFAQILIYWGKAPPKKTV